VMRAYPPCLIDDLPRPPTGVASLPPSWKQHLISLRFLHHESSFLFSSFLKVAQRRSISLDPRERGAALLVEASDFSAIRTITSQTHPQESRSEDIIYVNEYTMQGPDGRRIWMIHKWQLV
jgi:hypothetical protein